MLARVGRVSLETVIVGVRRVTKSLPVVTPMINHNTSPRVQPRIKDGKVAKLIVKRSAFVGPTK